jgi:patatin-like phospholipase
MAGALAYIYQQGKTFDVFYTSGGGALIGLLFVAPRGMRPDDALRAVEEFGIDERIYQLFPVGYKTFFKRSWLTRQFHDWADLLKLDIEPRPFPGQVPPPGYDPAQQRRRRLYNDVIDFWASALTPPRLGPTSRGLCTPLPFLEDIIDFELANDSDAPSGFDPNTPVRLPGLPGAYPLRRGWFYVNAYNLKAKQMYHFSNVDPADATRKFKGSLTPASMRAAFSFPFIYEPQEIDGALYCEGALVNPLNWEDAPQAILKLPPNRVAPAEAPPTLQYYLFDILGALEQKLMYSPRSLWGAYGLSILTPVISLANMSTKIFERDHPNAVTRIDFASFIPDKSSRHATDWSYPNTTALWDAGWEAGRRFIADHGGELPARVR